MLNPLKAITGRLVSLLSSGMTVRKCLNIVVLNGVGFISVPAAIAKPTRVAEIVDTFGFTPDRPLIAPSTELQAYSGVAGTTGSTSLPVGGGYGFTGKYELGIDSALQVQPFDMSQPLERLRIYGRVGLIEDLTAVQLGFWLPTAKGKPVGIEVRVPAQIRKGAFNGYGQASLLYKPQADHLMIGGVAVSGLYNIYREAYLGVDLGGTFNAAKLKAEQPALIGTGAPSVGYVVNDSTFARIRVAFSDLFGADESGEWNGLSNYTYELVVVKSFGKKKKKEKVIEIK
jgi:hypothetical protein